MNFLIGNICDLIEVDGENEEQVDQRNILTLLQKKVKYGVPNMTAISICESVFNDRLLAIELAQILSDANIGTCLLYTSNRACKSSKKSISCNRSTTYIHIRNLLIHILNRSNVFFHGNLCI